MSDPAQRCIHINDLPPEILAAIFIHHIVINRPNLGLRISNRTVSKDEIIEHDRLVIQSVCPHWSNVARSTPELWCTMYTEPLKRRLDTLGILAQLEVWIGLSGSVLPLSLSFHSSHTSLTAQEQTALIVFITRYAERWIQLRLRRCTVEFMHLVGLNPEQMFPQLRTLFLEAGDMAKLDISSRMFPRLRSLGLWYQHKPDAVCWTQLTTIELDHFDASEIRSVISHTSSLIHLRVHGLGAGTPGSDLPPIHLPSLETLDLSPPMYGIHHDTGTSWDNYDDFFEEVIIMPRLKRFRCIASGRFLPGVPVDQITPLEKFLFGSGCPPNYTAILVLLKLKDALDEEMDSHRDTLVNIPGLVVTFCAARYRDNCPVLAPLWSADGDPYPGYFGCRNCYPGSDQSKSGLADSDDSNVRRV